MINKDLLRMTEPMDTPYRISEVNIVIATLETASDPRFYGTPITTLLARTTLGKRLYCIHKCIGDCAEDGKCKLDAGVLCVNGAPVDKQTGETAAWMEKGDIT